MVPTALLSQPDVDPLSCLSHPENLILNADATGGVFITLRLSITIFAGLVDDALDEESS